MVTRHPAILNDRRISPMASKLALINKVESASQARIPKIQHNKQQDKMPNNEHVTDVIEKENRMVITLQVTSTK